MKLSFSTDDGKTWLVKDMTFQFTVLSPPQHSKAQVEFELGCAPNKLAAAHFKFFSKLHALYRLKHRQFIDVSNFGVTSKSLLKLARAELLQLSGHSVKLTRLGLLVYEFEYYRRASRGSKRDFFS